MSERLLRLDFYRVTDWFVHKRFIPTVSFVIRRAERRSPLSTIVMEYHWNPRRVSNQNRVKKKKPATGLIQIPRSSPLYRLMVYWSAYTFRLKSIPSREKCRARFHSRPSRIYALAIFKTVSKTKSCIQAGMETCAPDSLRSWKPITITSSLDEVYPELVLSPSKGKAEGLRRTLGR
jgi:hypothetical protein